MWQYYGLFGYALKLNISNLFRSAFVSGLQVDTERMNNTSIGKVIYDEEKQISLLKQKLDKIYKSGLKSIKEVNHLINDLCIQFEIQKLFYKNNAYNNEKEYRCLFSISSDDSIKANKYRLSKNGMIVPYIVVQFTNLDDIIEEIKIHPLMDEQLSKDGLVALFKTKKMKSIPITKSEIPFREL